MSVGGSVVLPLLSNNLLIDLDFVLLIDIQLMMNFNNFSDPQILHLLPSSGQSFNLV